VLDVSKDTHIDEGMERQLKNERYVRVIYKNMNYYASRMGMTVRNKTRQSHCLGMRCKIEGGGGGGEMENSQGNGRSKKSGRSTTRRTDMNERRDRSFRQPMKGVVQEHHAVQNMTP
jgi:hypothetical protein